MLCPQDSMGRVVVPGRRMGLVWVRSPYLGLPLPTQCEGNQCVDVEGGELAMSGELWYDVSPQEEGISGGLPLVSFNLAPTSSV